MTQWKKLGLLFRPDTAKPWMRSHAQNPFTLELAGGRTRMYFSSRDDRNYSSVGWADLDFGSGPAVAAVSSQPVVEPGPLGHFDDHGSISSSAVRQGHTVYLYYIGWNPGRPDPLFYTSIGLAVSTDGGNTFAKYSPAPIMARVREDPIMSSACCVMLDQGLFRMWYISGLGWFELPGGGLWSRYHIKYAESKDGIDWKRDGRVAIDLRGEETNIARPTVIKEDGIYKMWFPVNAGPAGGYRLGYAESNDGYAWVRHDERAGMARSDDGFDSKAITYPWVFKAGGETYMIYNGNNFGREGVGIAVREGGGR